MDKQTIKKKMIKYIIRNKKVLIVNKPRKLTKDMEPKDMAPEYLEKEKIKIWKQKH